MIDPVKVRDVEIANKEDFSALELLIRESESPSTGAPNENIVQNQLNMALLNVF